MITKIAPSLLSADFTDLGTELYRIEKAGADYVHIDVMDGMFVPNITIGPPIIKALRQVSNLTFDVHLMIMEPLRYLERFIDAGADIITVHQEACSDTEKTLRKIKYLGGRAGVTLKPETPLESIERVLDIADVVLVMSVHPGFGGQKIIPEMLQRAKELANIKKQRGLKFDIEMDGGICLDNIEDVIMCGVNIIVAGSALFEADDMNTAIAEFKEILMRERQS